MKQNTHRLVFITSTVDIIILFPTRMFFMKWKLAWAYVFKASHVQVEKNFYSHDKSILCYTNNRQSYFLYLANDGSSCQRGTLIMIHYLSYLNTVCAWPNSSINVIMWKGFVIMMKSNVIKQRNLTLRYIWWSSAEKRTTAMF